jgi:hypothetical protein
MGVTSSNFSSNYSDMGSPPHRSVCHQFELQTGDICLSNPRPESLGSYFAPVDCLTAPEMRLVAFSEKPFFLIDVLTATMRADGVSPGLDEASFP